jgi:hypothetical protein
METLNEFVIDRPHQVLHSRAGDKAGGNSGEILPAVSHCHFTCL